MKLQQHFLQMEVLHHPMEYTKKSFFKIAASCLSVAVILLFSAYIFYLVPYTNGMGDDSAGTGENRHYHVIIIGKSNNKSVLQQIYEGASSVGCDYDCVVELHVPQFHADDGSLQAQFDYASMANADGIIAYIDESESNIPVPVNRQGKNIPLITIAQYFPSIPQISYIGINYSEMGRLIARESNGCLQGSGSIVIINTNSSITPYYSTFMNSLTNTLSGYTGLNSLTLDLSSPKDILSAKSPVRTHLLKNQCDLIICLTTEDTIRTAQLLSDMHKNEAVRLIGFAEGDVADLYLSKNVITEMLSIDSQNIGKSAMKELFEYLKNGYANNYITADVRITKAGGI